MTGVAAGRQAEVLLHIGDMHVIALIERHAGGLTQTFEREAGGEVALGKRRRADQAIAHVAQVAGLTARQRLRFAANRGEHLALAQPFAGARLVIDDQVQLQRVGGQQGRQRGHKPGRQAVGIDGDADGQWLLGRIRQQLWQQFALELIHLAIVRQQLAPGGGGLQRCGADQQRLRHLLFQLFDALRHRRLRQAQGAGGAFEVLLLHHGIQRLQQPIVERQSGGLFH